MRWGVRVSVGGGENCLVWVEICEHTLIRGGRAVGCQRVLWRGNLAPGHGKGEVGWGGLLYGGGSDCVVTQRRVDIR